MMRRGLVPDRTAAIPLRILMLAIAAMLCFAANSLLCRLALAAKLVDAATFTTLRVVSGAAMLCLVVWLQRHRLPRLDRANPRSVASLFTYFVFFSFAYLRLDAGSGALILIGTVQLTMFSVAFWEGERFLASQWSGLAVALFGFVYLVLPGARAPDPLGAVLMAISGVAWGCFSLAARGASDPVETNAANLIGCLLPTAVVSLLAAQDIETSAAGMILAIASGGIATGIGYVVWYFALRGLPATYAATLQLSMPALVALGGVGLLSEPLTTRVLVASAMMLGGIGLVVQRAQSSSQ
jgi:drug/metabolite transporter (DMT)-like permease